MITVTEKLLNYLKCVVRNITPYRVAEDLTSSSGPTAIIATATSGDSAEQGLRSGSGSHLE